MKPKFLFDYVFYRLAQLYLRWEGKTPSTAVAALTFIQVIYTVTGVMLVQSIFFDRSQLTQYREYIRPVILIIGVVIVIWNYAKYYDKYDELKKYWKDEDQKERKQKGFLIFFLYLIPIVVLVLMILYKEGKIF